MPQAKSYKFILVLLIFALSVSAQTLTETHQKIRLAVENRDYQTAVSELENLEKSDKKVFALNNYDYLLARMAGKRGDFALAMGNYQAVVNRNSVLSEYALWHLSQIAQSSGNLLLERIYLQKILTLAPESLLTDAAQTRMARSYFESKNFEVTIQMLSSQKAITDKGQTKNDGRTRENLVLLGSAYLQVGKLNEAREVFTRLTNNLSNPAQPDDFALAGAKSLDELDGGLEKFGKTAPQLPETEHQRRAAIYQFNRNFPLARLHYQAIVERFPTYSFASNALYQIGRGFAQEGNYAQAIQWFERLQAQFPTDEVSRDALSQTASAYVRVNQPTEAILHYQKFIEKYPNADNLERAYLNIVDIWRDSGNDAEALTWTAKTQAAFKGKLPEAIALFAQARIHIAQNDWKNALSDLNTLLTLPDLGGTRVPGGTNKTEIIFLKGFALENSNHYAEAIDTYLLIPDGRNEYYGWRATERLHELNKVEKAQFYIEEAIRKNLEIANEEILSNIAERNSKAESMRSAAQNVMRLTTNSQFLNKINRVILNTYNWLPEYHYIKKIPFDDRARQCFPSTSSNGTGAPSPNFSQTLYSRCELRSETRSPKPKRKGHYIIVEELIFLGLYDEAAPELAFALGANDSFANLSKEDAYTLALAFKRGDMANFAVAFIEPIWKNVPADYLIELIPREQIELLYPTPYADALVQFAPPRNVDPRFLLAIMRQESRYRADVKSYAAARGSMQFISTTADKIARELEKENFNQDELYHPPTAILFGSQYLSNLFKIFPNQPPAVAASYNGGEDNMTRWFARSKSASPDRYVPEIAFSQSKDYVYKVMANYRVYQMFYDEQLKAR